MVLLGALEHLTSERDHERLQATMMRILIDLSAARQAVLHSMVEDEFVPVLVAEHGGELRQADPDVAWPVDPQAVKDTVRRFTGDPETPDSVLAGDALVAHALRGPKGLAGIVTLRYCDAEALRPWWISSFLKTYQNHVNLINDAECDTLTGLFNRKTFENRINRLLAMQREAQVSPQVDTGNRRAIRPGEHNWLAVVDIDHFKSVNDRFGHVYGDEVLILLARLMMRGFRMEDRLFRFGGEEFVIVLSPCAAAGAALVLERFRSSIEKYDFPQVGRVTASVGYTRIRLDDMPSVTVGRADEALYYAKRNGRNRVCSHEHLTAAGDIRTAAAVESKVTLF